MTFDFISEKVVKIRKERRCFACFRIFQIKQEMCVVTGAEDGSISTAYYCKTCWEILNHHIKLYDNEIWPEHVINEMSDYGFSGNPEEFLEFLKSKALQEQAE